MPACSRRDNTSHKYSEKPLQNLPHSHLSSHRFLHSRSVWHPCFSYPCHTDQYAINRTDLKESSHYLLPDTPLLHMHLIHKVRYPSSRYRQQSATMLPVPDICQVVDYRHIHRILCHRLRYFAALYISPAKSTPVYPYFLTVRLLSSSAVYNSPLMTKAHRLYRKM